MKLFLLLAGAALAFSQEYDILIRNGRLVDGTGNPSFIGDLAIRDGKIAAMGHLGDRPAKRTIDAKGLIVAPGFIDIHNHSDYTLLIDGNAESMIRQGVTSMIFGEGGSAAPTGGKQERVRDEGDFKDFDAYFARLLKGGISTNIGTYVGSSQIWTYVRGPQAGPPTKAELAQMQDLVRQAMRQGALGVASSLSGPPGSWIDTDTLIAMCKAAAPFGGIYSTHMRTEGQGVFESVAEAIRIGREGGVPVDIIHVKLADHKLWGQMPELISTIAQARANGQEVTANVYPYRAGQNNLSTIIPPWAHEGGTKALIARLKDPALRPRLEDEIEHGIKGSDWYDHYTATGSWEGMLLVTLSNPAYKKYEGKRMSEVIADMGGKPLDVLFKLLEDNNGSVPTIYFHHDEKDMRYALQQPFVSIGSDGLAFKTEGPLSKGNPHPRSYGTFVRVLGRYVRDEHVITMEDAVRKMTSANAAKIHIYDRGLLRPGLWADVTVFDPAKIIDNATYTKPHQYASGVEYVFVNGKLTLEHDKHLGTRAGAILYGPGREQNTAAVHKQLTERQVAEWVLRQGGGVLLDGSRHTIRELPNLPATPFHITGVDLIGSIIDPKEIWNLSGLAELRELLLPGPIFNPFAGSTLDANDELEALANLNKLEKLQFSLHFLTNVNVQDKGLERLKNIKTLRELRLAQTRILGPSLVNFPNVEELDLSDVPFTDSGMQYLAKLPKLKRLYLRDTLISDKGLQYLSGLHDLEALDLYGTNIGDAGVRTLAGLTRLRSLNLLGARLSDDGIDALAAMTQLEDLNLYRSETTNAGLEKLKKLKHLASLDLRYSRVTRGGIDSFLATDPNCKIDFQDTAPRLSDPKLGESKPAGLTAQAVLAWVEKMGGKGSGIKVNLSNTPVTDAQLAYLQPLSQLASLDLRSTQISDAGADAISKLASLQELILSSTTISDKGAAKLTALHGLKKLILNNTFVESLPHFDSLEEVQLAGTRFSDKGLEQLGGMKSLRSLRLDYTDITNDGLKYLEPLSGLESLDLSSVDIDDEGLPHIGKLTGLTELLLNYGRFTDKGIPALASLTGLRHLELVRTKLTDESVKTLAALPDLKRLNLNYTSITDKGIAELQPNLVELQLDSSGLTDAGVPTLSKFTNLESVNIYHTLVTEKGFNELKSSLPKCHIIFDRASSLPNRRHS